jgi:YfiH family protein
MTAREGGVSTGPLASWNLGRVPHEDPAALEENVRRLVRALDLPSRPRFPRQVHGNRVLVAADEEPASPLGEADAVVVTESGACAGVLGADCPGVLVVDPVRRAFAVAHSGWHGTVLGVVPAAIRALRRAAGSRPQDLLVGIGPGICGRCYEVGPEVVAAVRNAVPAAESAIAPGRGDRSHLDLATAIRRQVEAEGVPATSVEASNECTRESRRLYSHRRDGPATGRHALVAAFRPR